MACTATWSQVLTYELELRKAAYRFVRDGKSSCLNSAIEKAIDSTDLLNLHFTIPMTLGKKQSCPGEEEVAAPPPPAPHPAGRQAGAPKAVAKTSRCLHGSANGEKRPARQKANRSASSSTSKVAAMRARVADLNMSASGAFTATPSLSAATSAQARCKAAGQKCGRLPR